MNHYVLKISYNGSPFNGWQKLPNNTNTIQYIIEKALSDYLCEPINLRASGRTDAKVNAFCQVADFFCNTTAPDDFIIQINNLLPKDIRIIEISPADVNFHSRKSAKSKTYCYLIDISDKCDVFARKYTYSPLDPPVKAGRFTIDIEKIRLAAKKLTGTHDFSAFTTDKSLNKSHIRTINEINIYSHLLKSGKKILVFEITGNGFLYNMVRIISGTLLYCGLGLINPEAITEIIKGKVRSAAGPTLPGNALFLKCVYYD